MRKLIVFLLFFVAAGTLAAACGDDDSDKGSSAESVSRAQFPEKVAAALCSRAFSCCTPQEMPEVADVFDMQEFSTEEECRAGISAQLEAGFKSSEDKSIAAGKVEYRADIAGKCVSQLKAAACGEGLIPEAFKEEGACVETFEGKVDAGGECEASSECRVGDCVGIERNEDDGSITKAGTCQAPGDTGEECEERACKSGNYCHTEYDAATQSLTSTCKKIAQMDEECTPYGCVEGAYCDVDLADPSATGTCKALKSEGEACSYGECNAETYCGGGQAGGADRTCMKFKSAGEACTSSDECRSYRCAPPADDPQGQTTCQEGGGEICTGS